MKAFLFNVMLCFLSGFAGIAIGVYALNPSFAQTPSETQEIRARQISIIGKDGDEQIVLKAEASGPIILLKNKKGSQELLLKVSDKTVESCAESSISFWKKPGEKPLAYIQAREDDAVTLGMGHQSYPDWIQMSSQKTGKAAGANLSLGFFSSPSVELKSKEHYASLEVNTLTNGLLLKGERNKSANIIQCDYANRTQKDLLTGKSITQ